MSIVKMQNKFVKSEQSNPLTSQNSRPIGMSPSGVIFNLVSLVTNDWTPPLIE